MTSQTPTMRRSQVLHDIFKTQVGTHTPRNRPQTKLSDTLDHFRQLYAIQRLVHSIPAKASLHVVDSVKTDQGSCKLSSPLDGYKAGPSGPGQSCLHSSVAPLLASFRCYL
jgi:hypothetical protein